MIMSKTPLALILALAALSGCAPRWSGHSTRIDLSGAQLNPARTLPPEKEPAPFLIKLPVTAGEHSEAANRYLDLAAKYRSDAAAHRAMKALYDGKDPAMSAHCDALTRQLSLLADQCEEIGKMYEEKAVQLGKPSK